MKIAQNLKNREKLLLLAAFGVILIGLLIRLVVLPLSENQQQLSLKLKDAQRRLVKARSFASSVASAQAYKSFADAVTFDGSDEKQSAGFLEDIEKLSKQSSVNILVIRPGEIRDKESYKMFSVQIQAEGSFRAVLNFLFAIESSPGFYKVERCSINASGKKGVQDLLVTVFKMSIPTKNSSR